MSLTKIIPKSSTTINHRKTCILSQRQNIKKGTTNLLLSLLKMVELKDPNPNHIHQIISNNVLHITIINNTSYY